MYTHVSIVFIGATIQYFFSLSYILYVRIYCVAHFTGDFLRQWVSVPRDSSSGEGRPFTIVCNVKRYASGIICHGKSRASTRIHRTSSLYTPRSRHAEIQCRGRRETPPYNSPSTASARRYTLLLDRRRAESMTATFSFTISLLVDNNKPIEN